MPGAPVLLVFVQSLYEGVPALPTVLPVSPRASCSPAPPQPESSSRFQLLKGCFGVPSLRHRPACRHPVAAYCQLPTPLRQLTALPTPLRSVIVAARPTIEPSGACQPAGRGGGFIFVGRPAFAVPQWGCPP